MLPITLGVTPNGYPWIDVNPPYELFGEFLRAEHSVENATRVHDITLRVAAGNLPTARIIQDYATLELDHQRKTADVAVDFYGAGSPTTSTVPLELFTAIIEAWLSFIKGR